MATSLIEPAVAVEIGDLRVLKQKRDRFAAAMKRGGPFVEFQRAVDDYLRATDIILTEHLPPAEAPAKEQ